MSFKKLAGCLVLGAFALGIIGCEDEERAALFDAQECINNINENLSQTEITTAANACEAKLNGASSSEAEAIRCSAKLIAGGLTTSRFVDAFKAMDEGQGSKEAKLMVLLSFTGTDAMVNARSMFNACQKSGVPGLVFVAGVSLSGTSISSIYGSGTCGKTPTNPNDTLCDGQEVENILNQCKADSSQCNTQDIGNSAIAISDAYCLGDNADKDICKDIGTAITNAGGDPATIGAQLLNLLDKN